MKTRRARRHDVGTTGACADAPGPPAGTVSAMEPPPPGALSVAGWSATVGSSQSKIIDLLVSAAVNVVAVTGVVMLFALESLPVRVIGGVLLGLATVVVAWLLRREAARLSPLLTAYAGSRLVLLVGVAAAYLARRPDQVAWIWVATGLALLAVLTEPTIKVLLSKTEQVAVNLPGVRPVPAPPFRPDRIAVGSLVVVVVGGVLAALAAPAWLYLCRCAAGFRGGPDHDRVRPAGQPDQQGLVDRTAEGAGEVRAGLRRLLRRRARRPVPAGHVAALPGAARQALRRDHPRGRDGADDHRADAGAGGGAADQQRTGQPGRAGGEVDEGRLLRPGQSGEPQLPAPPTTDPRLAQPR